MQDPHPTPLTEVAILFGAAVRLNGVDGQVLKLGRVNGEVGKNRADAEGGGGLGAALRAVADVDFFGARKRERKGDEGALAGCFHLLRTEGKETGG